MHASLWDPGHRAVLRHSLEHDATSSKCRRHTCLKDSRCSTAEGCPALSTMRELNKCSACSTPGPSGVAGYLPTS